MIRNIATHLFLLVLFPAKAWERIAEENEPAEQFLNRYLFPVMGITALSVFGKFRYADFSIESALKWATVEIVRYLAGFFILSYVTEEWTARLYHRRINRATAQKYTGCLLSLTMVTTAVLHLLPDSCSRLGIVTLYIAYVAWAGAKRLLDIPDARKPWFVAAISAAVLLVPLIIKYILLAVMPGIEMKTV